MKNESRPLAVGILACLTAGELASAEPTPADARVFVEHCAGCHGTTGQGTFGPSLRDAVFKKKWTGKEAALGNYIVTRMPPAGPGSLPPATYSQITAFLSSLSGLQIPAVAMAATNQAPSGTPDQSKGDYASGGLVDVTDNQDEIYKATVAQRKILLDGIQSVDEASLRDPPPAQWLNWRRTDDGWGFSPLQQIDRSNVRSMTVAWAFPLPHGTNGITPLVNNGVIFVHSSGVVIAIDAQRGDTLWTFSRPATVTALGPPVSQPRNMAMLGNILYVPTVDNHMLALDSRSGQLLWDHLIEKSDGVLRLTGGPIVVHGNIIQGVSGCAGSKIPGGCFIVALDAQSGNEVWRFNTIQRPGGPRSDTWNGIPLSERFGGSVWSSGTYSQVDNLVYFGTGQTYHITPLMKSRPGYDNSALYTDTTLALNPDTGKLVWFYQHLRRDVWDLDWSYEQTLMTLPTPSGPRRFVATMGKLGILDVLEAKTGRYAFSYDVGLQDLVISIDSRTGAKQTDPQKEPDPQVPKTICPFPAGVRSWPGTAYDPSTSLLYVPVSDTCMKFSWKPGEEWDIAYSPIPHPGSDGKMGAVVAIDLKSRKQSWAVWRRAPEASAMLVTSGGLVFEGGRDRWFRASDSSTGQILWQMRLDNVPSASPISYGVQGKQFVAVATGGGGPQDVSREGMTPEIEPTAAANTLWVFKLPEEKRP